MTLNTETLSALRSVDRLDAIAKHLKSMPLAHRADAIESIQRGLRKREWIEKARISSAPPMSRIVVAVDPAMSTKPTSSETGIVVVGADALVHAITDLILDRNPIMIW